MRFWGFQEGGSRQENLWCQTVVLSFIGIVMALTTAERGMASSSLGETGFGEMAFCAALGPKHAGSEANRLMSDHILKIFEQSGLEAFTEDFHLPVYETLQASLEIVSPEKFTPKAILTDYSEDADMEAEIVGLGEGGPKDYEGRDVQGKLALVTRSRFYKQARLAKDHGAAGLLIVSTSPDNLVLRAAATMARQLPLGIPVFSLGAQDGRRILGLLETGPVVARLLSHGVRKDAIGRNVFGVKRGARDPDHYVIVGAHYDSWVAGAVDNCSSVGGLLAIAGRLKDLDLPYTTILAAWDAEEIGLIGSIDFAMKHPESLARTVLYENFEMLSAVTYLSGRRLPLSISNLVFVTQSPLLRQTLREAFNEATYVPLMVPAPFVRVFAQGEIPTDMQTFYAGGVQSFSSYSSTPFYHTTEDTPDKIDPKSYDTALKAFFGAFLRLESKPAKVLIDREVPLVRLVRAGERELRITVLDPHGQPLEGQDVSVLITHNDHWPLLQGKALEAGGGVYSFAIPQDLPQGPLWAEASLTTPIVSAAGYLEIDNQAERFRRNSWSPNGYH